MICYAITRADDEVSLIYFEDASKLEQEIEKWKGTAHSSWLPIRSIDLVVNSLPSKKERQYRKSWRIKDNRLYINLETAKGQMLDELRRKRDAALELSDVDQVRLNDIGTAEQQRAIKIYRQKLRDFPIDVQQKLSLIISIEDLMAFEIPLPEKPND